MVDASFDEHFMRMALREAEKAAVRELLEVLTDQDAIDLCEVALYGHMKEEPFWATVDWMGKRLRQPGARRAVLALIEARKRLPAVPA